MKNRKKPTNEKGELLLNPIKGFLKTLVESTEKGLNEPRINDLEEGNREVQGSAVIVPRVRKQMPKLKPDHELKWVGGRRTPGRGRWTKKNRIRPSKRKNVKPKELHWNTKRLKSKKTRLYNKKRALDSPTSSAAQKSGYWSTITGTYFVFRRNVRRELKRKLTKQLREEVVLSGRGWSNSLARKVKKRVKELLDIEFSNFKLDDWKNVWLASGRVIDRNGDEVLAFKARSKFKKGGTRISKIDKYKPYSLTNVKILYENRDVLYPKFDERSKQSLR